MSAGGGGLRHGVAAMLIEAAKRGGLKLSEREIQRRLQCARIYSTESQIGSGAADFRTWYDLSEANLDMADSEGYALAEA